MQLAARLATAGRPAAGLVLITPLKSLRAVLRRHPVFAWLTPWLRSPLDSIAAARALRGEVLVLLAEHDRQVPHAHSLALAEALRRAGAGVTVHRLPGTNHRSLARTPAAMACLGGWLAAPALASRA